MCWYTNKAIICCVYQISIVESHHIKICIRLVFNFALISSKDSYLRYNSLRFFTTKELYLPWYGAYTWVTTVTGFQKNSIKLRVINRSRDNINLTRLKKYLIHVLKSILFLLFPTDSPFYYSPEFGIFLRSSAFQNEFRFRLTYGKTHNVTTIYLLRKSLFRNYYWQILRRKTNADSNHRTMVDCIIHFTC